MTRPLFESAFDAVKKEDSKSIPAMIREREAEEQIAYMADTAIQTMVNEDRITDITYEAPNFLTLEDIEGLNGSDLHESFKELFVEVMEESNKRREKFINITAITAPFKFGKRKYTVKEEFERGERTERDPLKINHSKYIQKFDYGRVTVEGVVDTGYSSLKTIPLVRIDYIAGFGQMDNPVPVVIVDAEARVAVPFAYPQHELLTVTTAPGKQDIVKLQEMFTGLRDGTLEAA